MWPFRRKRTLPGFEMRRNGSATFVLTDEEQQSVSEEFALFGDTAVLEAIADQFRRLLTARGLSGYANRQIMIAGFDSHRGDRTRLIETAIAAATKAYSIYPLPIYLYDMATFIEMAGRGDAARDAFKTFLEHQEVFTPDQVEAVFLQERDIDEAIADASGKLSVGQEQ